MIELSEQQEALLRLPDPDTFTARLSNEIRRDMGREVSHLSDTQLLEATRRSYFFAVYDLHITRIPTLVRWVRLDVVSEAELRREVAVVLRIQSSADPNLAAEDLLSIFLAQTNWSF